MHTTCIIQSSEARANRQRRVACDQPVLPFRSIKAQILARSLIGAPYQLVPLCGVSIPVDAKHLVCELEVRTSDL
jgi:hypothetical protein